MSKRQALVIGINQYPFGDSLSKAAEDAERIAKVLEEYGSFEVHLLPCKEDVREVDPEKNVDLKELEDAINQLFQPKSGITPETALLFFAGHGCRREKNGQPEGFLVTSDALFEQDSEDGLFSLKRLHQILKDSPVRQQIVWLDCCHSGELFNFLENDLDEFEQQRKIDRCFIAACREFQVAYGGVLTPALEKVLYPANKEKGRVTNLTLKPLLETALQNAPQHSVVINIGSQILITYKGGVRGNICPYKGLKYFYFNPTKPEEAEDHKYFYGRTQLTNQLLNKVRSHNFLAVLGASGSGKSSVVRAGLLYQLYLGKEIRGSDRWTIYPPFNPGIHPVAALEQLIGVKLETANDFVNFLKRSPSDRVVLVVDQFEEVFTQCRDVQERDKFFAYLINAAEYLSNKLCLVLIMRDDFQHKCAEQEYSGLANNIDNNLVRVQRMNSQELKEVILEPAKLVDLEIDGDLVKEMIDDVSHSPGDLALLQYTLTQLWENTSFNLLTISDYTSLGGVQKALGNHADTVYKSLSQEEQKAAQRIFIELTRLSEDENTPNTRQQVWQKDLVDSQQSEELVNRVVQRLADAKLVVTSEKELDGQRVAVVNIVHETLIRNWGSLDGWLKEYREALLIKQEIEDAAKKWREQSNNHNRKPNTYGKLDKLTASVIHYHSLLIAPQKSYLLQGMQLKRAVKFIKYNNEINLSIVSESFVRLSLQRRKYLHRSIIVVGFSVVSIFSLLWTRLYTQSRLSLSQNLVQQSEELRKQPAEFQTSMLLAVEAVKIHESPETTRNLWNGLTLLPKNIQTLETKPSKGTESSQKDIELSRTKKYQINQISDNIYGAIVLKQLNNHEEIKPFNPFAYDSYVNYDFSPNDKYIVMRYCKNDGCSAILLDLTNHAKAESERVKLGASDDFYKIKFSHNSKYIATVKHKNELALWNANSRKKNWEIKTTGNQVKEIAFSPGDKYLVITNSNQIRLLEPTTGRTLKTINRQNSNDENIVFSPDGKYLFGTSQRDESAYSESSVFVSQVWDMETGSEIARFTDKDEIKKVTYASDSKFLNIAYRKGTVKQWEPESRWVLPLVSQEHILSLNFSNDRKYLVAIGQTNGGVFADIWDIISYKKIKNFDLASNSSTGTTSVYAVLFSNDFKYLFVSLEVGRLGGYRRQLHEIKTGEEISSFWDDDSSSSFDESCNSRSIWKAERYSARCIDGSAVIVKEILTNEEIKLFKSTSVSAQQLIEKIKNHDHNAIFIKNNILSESRFKEIVDEENNDIYSEDNNDSINSITLSKDGKLLAVANASGTEKNKITLVNLPQNKLTDEVCQSLTRNLTSEEWKQHLPREGYRKTCLNLP